LGFENKKIKKLTKPEICEIIKAEEKHYSKIKNKPREEELKEEKDLGYKN
jgi:hypothetical protein